MIWTPLSAELAGWFDRPQREWSCSRQGSAARLSERRETFGLFVPFQASKRTSSLKEEERLLKKQIDRAKKDLEHRQLTTLHKTVTNVVYVGLPHKPASRPHHKQKQRGRNTGNSSLSAGTGWVESLSWNNVIVFWTQTSVLFIIFLSWTLLTTLHHINLSFPWEKISVKVALVTSGWVDCQKVPISGGSWDFLVLREFCYLKVRMKKSRWFRHSSLVWIKIFVHFKVWYVRYGGKMGNRIENKRLFLKQVPTLLLDHFLIEYMQALLGFTHVRLGIYTIGHHDPSSARPSEKPEKSKSCYCRSRSRKGWCN